MIAEVVGELIAFAIAFIIIQGAVEFLLWLRDEYNRLDKEIDDDK